MNGQSRKQDRRLIFFGGKGGVGKTTLAADFAALLAGRGEKTLLVSTDPAHSTSDVLDAKLSGEPARIEENLWGVEIDAAAAAAARLCRSVGRRFPVRVAKSVITVVVADPSNETLDTTSRPVPRVYSSQAPRS